MTANAVPKKWPWSEHDNMPTAYGQDGSLAIHCTLISPPSREGQDVWVHFTGEDIDHFLREFRDAAVIRRSLHEGAPT
jgi:hypothetical protein